MMTAGETLSIVTVSPVERQNIKGLDVWKQNLIVNSFP